MERQYYRCTSPDCDFVTMREDTDVCPLCGNGEFVPADESEITPRGWLCLCREADRDGTQTLAYDFCRRGAATGAAAVQRQGSAPQPGTGGGLL